MTEHARTAIRRLSIRGFRSIRAVDLDNIPDLVVLHGPNGAGKSNLLRAVQLLLGVASRAGSLPPTQERPAPLSLEEADKLDLRPEDFHTPEGGYAIRIAADVSLGARAAEIVRAGDLQLPALLSLEVLFRLRPGDNIEYWFPRFDFDGTPLKEYFNPLRREGLALVEGIRGALLPRLVQVSPAYRVPGGQSDPEAELYRKCLRRDPLERDTIRRLERRLARAQLFGPGGERVAIFPVDDERYHEHHILLTHPTHGELPIRNLGSGEQQLLYMLAQEVITPFPIAHVEEPEAHLHTSLMEPLAKILHESVVPESGAPDVDQLWIATHHHHFALALEYFDVRLADGATVVVRKPRAKAAPHFYEPGPIWEALRQLALSAKTRSAVVFRNAEGAAVTAAEILDSIDNDPEQRVAMEYARAMTEAMVLAMRQRAEKP